MVSLGQKLEMPKTCKKTIQQQQHICSVRKTARKSTKYWEKKDNLDNRSSTKGYTLCKMVSLGQKLKMPKTWEKPFYNNSTLVLCKKLLEKTPNIGEMRQL